MKRKFLTPFQIQQIERTCANCAAKVHFPTTMEEYSNWVRAKVACGEALLRMHWEQLGLKISPDWPAHHDAWCDELRYLKSKIISDIGDRIVNET